MKPFNTPILLLIFNRPDTTARVFAEIRKIQPKKLFIAADGPRPNHPEDRAGCEQARKISSAVDWPCDVQILFRDENLGCKIAVTSAVDWFFSMVDDGIILEDDCLPNQSFFPFCEELLTRYRDNELVMMVSGNNFAGSWPSDHSYFYSKYSGSWGWATWKRAWKKYDGKMSSWADPEVQERVRKNIGNHGQWKLKKWTYDSMHAGKRNSVWDYAWEQAMLAAGGLCIIPRCNLVQNIGFDITATHTRSDGRALSIPRKEMVFPLVHDSRFAADTRYDRYFIEKVFGRVGYVHRVFKRLLDRGSHILGTYSSVITRARIQK